MDMTAGISLPKPDRAADYLEKISPADADADFYKDVSKNSEYIRAVSFDGKIVGLASVQEDAEAFIYIYIFPEYRRRGFGRSALCAAEQLLDPNTCTSIGTAYDSNSEIGAKFAQKCGYEKKFSTCVMSYHGEKFDLPPLPIRKYRDEDFYETYTMSAEAFHVMRVETGHDPNSVPYPADEAARKLCAETADERYVYIVGDEIVSCAHLDGAEISVVATKLSRQGMGYGRNFVKFLVNLVLENRLGEPFLYCLSANKKARRLYDSLGFTESACNVYAEKKLT